MINIDARLSDADWSKRTDDSLEALGVDLESLGIKTLGGAGSGDHGHSGRPGQVGGSFSTHGAEHDKRKKELGIPPGWHSVEINRDKNGDMLARGRDSKNRGVYIYSKSQKEQAAVEKFQRGEAFNKALPGLRKQIQDDLKNPNAPHADKEAAAVLTLIEKTGFRVGGSSDTQAEKQAYGASTLLARHVEIDGDTVTFRFVGKKGVDQDHTYKDKAMADMLRPRVAAGGRLFDTNDTKVRQYLQSRKGGEDFVVKDYRTWNGTTVALKAINKMDAPSTPKEYQVARNRVGDIVAAHLGNARNESLKSYIAPSVWIPWQHKTGSK